MSVAQAVAPHLPLLRRYGRALAGSQRSGDAYVKVTLQALLEDQSALDPNLPPRVALYRLFHAIWGSTAASDGRADDDMEAKAQERLKMLPMLDRQALLLTTIEGFTVEEAATIMGVDSDRAAQLVLDARFALQRMTRSRVLIIEDELLIGLDLQDIVTALGHDVVDVVGTADAAVEAAMQHRPNLVLADIQLADGSSGIDAVRTILSRLNVPVIFITAFPDRLLTGERPEPTFLITKPYSEETVQAGISQALFFESSSAN